MKILVSGSSGLVGSRLCPALLEAGHDVYRLVRRAPVADDERRWDPGAGQLDPAAVADCAAIIHLGGVNVGQRWTAARKKAILDSRVDSARLLAETVAETRPQVFICASAIGIYGDGGDAVLTEDSAHGEGFLAEVCEAWEAACQPARDAGVRVVNLRIGLVLDAHDGALGRMLPIFKLGLGGRLGAGTQWMSWIGIDDLCRVVEHLLTSPLDGPVNAVGPQPVTNREFTRALGEAIHRPTWLPAPAFMLELVFGQMAKEALLAGARVHPARLLAEGFEFETPALEQCLEQLLGSD